MSEQQRLEEAREKGVAWKKWGPYLSERQWGTVREDYSTNGDAWNYFSHDQSRSRAYRWGEDGLAGVSDDKQQLCFALALWNEKDPILKERLFGLTNSEGNHGEDVKEYYFYLDSTPTHSYMKWLYKYPQSPFPYGDLLQNNRQRGRLDFEYELIDTGIFNEGRYFDIVVEYAKGAPEDLLVRITAHNRGSEAAPLHLLPTLWFRNTWSWGEEMPRPLILGTRAVDGVSVLNAFHVELGERWLCAEGAARAVFTENETNTERLFHVANANPYVKDAFHRWLIDNDGVAVNPERKGTKAAFHYPLSIPAHGSISVRLRLVDGLDPEKRQAEGRLFADFDDMFAHRSVEADEFYEQLTPATLTSDEKNVVRQACAGMLWSKQYYYFDVDHWLAEHGATALAPRGGASRNHEWFHMLNSDIISMPDKWEYPWYAAWDLAFHSVALSMLDSDFAKDQLELMLRELYLHPSGQIPAYEWNFSDVNPPVHAWAILFNMNIERARTGKVDFKFLESAFQKLLVNFTWWVNRKDPGGKNVFEGGFLGLDNIGVFDRSSPLPTGGRLEQADGTAWMAFYSQCMLELSLELAAEYPAYEDMALKFLEHFLWIGAAMNRIGEHEDELWDERDGFFYDLLRMPDGNAMRLTVRSMVGLLPLCATTVIEESTIQHLPRFRNRAASFIRRHADRQLGNLAPIDRVGQDGRRLLCVLNEENLRRVLHRMLDEKEFLGPYGIRSLSAAHRESPYVLSLAGNTYRVEYEPAESRSGMFGGNSNWRGPVWVPVNALLVRALIKLHMYYGDSFRVECPTGSGIQRNLFEVALEIDRRLAATFLRGADGRRPVYGGTKQFQEDPHWRDLILFYEYFHGDNGAGLGASHQTGWTGLVARLMQLFAGSTLDQSLARDLVRHAEEASAGPSR
jgi:hypothetical protein